MAGEARQREAHDAGGLFRRAAAQRAQRLRRAQLLRKPRGADQALRLRARELAVPASGACTSACRRARECLERIGVFL